MAMISLGILLLWFCLRQCELAVTHPGEKDDVIGQYKLNNKLQCQRLCWYRRLCSSYSFTSDDLGAIPTANNCVLHTDSVTRLTTGATSPSDLCLQAGWSQKKASSKGILNGCQDRRCSQSEVCVPTSSGPASVSSVSASHRCMWLPSQCGAPDQVAHADFNVTGTSRQDDVAHLTCYSGYVATPRNVSVDIRCLVTSRWTEFHGMCTQYEFNFSSSSHYFHKAMPWKPELNSKFCVQGIFTGDGQCYINFSPDTTNDNIDVHLSFRHQFGGTETRIIWNTKENRDWGDEQILGEMPLVAGDSFTLTLHVQRDVLHITLNEVFDYNIALLQDGVDGIDLSKSTFFETGGAVDLTYINLISGC